MPNLYVHQHAIGSAGVYQYNSIYISQKSGAAQGKRLEEESMDASLQAVFLWRLIKLDNNFFWSDDAFPQGQQLAWASRSCQWAPKWSFAEIDTRTIPAKTITRVVGKLTFVSHIDKESNILSVPCRVSWKLQLHLAWTSQEASAIKAQRYAWESFVLFIANRIWQLL